MPMEEAAEKFASLLKGTITFESDIWTRKHKQCKALCESGASGESGETSEYGDSDEFFFRWIWVYDYEKQN